MKCSILQLGITTGYEMLRMTTGVGMKLQRNDEDELVVIHITTGYYYWV